MSVRPRPYYELYRKSTLGVCLTEVLDDLIRNSYISQDQALKILLQFDASINDALERRVKGKVNFKGHVDYYRFCDNVWTFIIDHATIQGLEGMDAIKVDKLKIVACDAQNTRAL
eukprot:TRINITY_DN1383_c0_g1_i3.p1 TRINITY_DN1383_c0_g1~~TRINITY_DN1383_c0_g1_i3.p1  ORF type:complete len:115 (-),score=12.91 TRINITY_DN1383_c0_g1_i3:166-510(-)